MSGPVVLDLFSGAGGAAMGYRRAGFEVVGVDIAPQPRYPFRFIQADVTTLPLAELAAQLGAVAVHASPPCQLFSPLAAYDRSKVVGKYPDLVAPTRDMLVELGLPWVLENVPQAPLVDPVQLCGAMFGVQVYRHRAFEAAFPMVQPAEPKHEWRCARNGNLPRPGEFMTITGGKHSRAWQRKACEVMGVPWMAVPADTDVERNQIGIRELCESIPPAMTEYVGAQLMVEIRGGVAA